MIQSPIRLLARLPTIMQKYEELQQITNAQDPEFELIVIAERLMRENLYFVTAKEHGYKGLSGC